MLSTSEEKIVTSYPIGHIWLKCWRKQRAGRVRYPTWELKTNIRWEMPENMATSLRASYRRWRSMSRFMGRCKICGNLYLCTYLTVNWYCCLAIKSPTSCRHRHRQSKERSQRWYSIWIRSKRIPSYRQDRHFVRAVGGTLWQTRRILKFNNQTF